MSFIARQKSLARGGASSVENEFSLPRLPGAILSSEFRHSYPGLLIALHIKGARQVLTFS